MNRMKSLFVVFSLSLFTMNASAVTTIPVPISEDEPLRFGAAIRTSAAFSPFAIQELTGIAGLAYGFGGGFEGGFQIRSGGNSGKLFAAGYVTSTELGGDLMLRYLGNVGDSFYLGLQGRFGYDYTFGQPSLINASNVTASVGLALGVSFSRLISVYVMPEIDFGRRANRTEGAFGSLVGLGASVGMYVCLGFPKLYFEVKPGTKDIGNKVPNAFVMDASLGLAFEI
jgi:hypothetical protein